MKHSSLFKKPSNWGHRSITCNHSQATTQHFKAYNKICLTVSVGLRRYAALRFRKFFGLEIGLGTLRRLATKPRVSDDFLRQTGVGWVTPVDVALVVVTQVIEESTCEGKLRSSTTLGSGCSTTAERMPRNREVVGSNPLSSQKCILNSGPSRRCNNTDFPIKIYLTVQLEAKQA